MRSLLMSRFKAVVPVIAVLALLFSPIGVAAQAEAEPSPDAPWGGLALWFAPLPAVFESGLQYEARTSLGHFTFDSSGYTFLAMDDAERAVKRVRMEFRLGRAQSLVPSGQLSGIVNDLRGADPSAWRSNIPTYSRLTYRALYPGIDLQYEGRPGRLKSLYVVSPGADANHIRWEYDGAESVSVTRPNGELWIRLPGETGDERYLIEAAPVAWQELGPRKMPVMVTYDVGADGSVGFDISEYDRSRPLIIDPFLSYAVVVGGSSDDQGRAVAVDGNGNVYVTGNTLSPDFPQAGPPQEDYGSAPQGSNFGDAFIMKLNAAGNALVYMTYLGGSGSDIGDAIAVNSQGEAFVTGATTSQDFPVPNAYQNMPGGQACSAPPCADAFVAKLNAAGNALVFSTYLGGERAENTSLLDTGTLSTRVGIAVDGDGKVYVTGRTDSPNFPMANAAYGNLAGLADLFLSVLSADGQSLLYSTYLGGTGADYGGGVAVGVNGVAYITGGTLSSNFPTKNAYQGTNAGIPDAVVAGFDTTKSGAASLLFSTYLGGSDADQGFGIALDGQGVHVAGFSQSTNFPTPNGFQLTNASLGQPNPYDGVVATLSAAGNTLLYATYLGGGSYDVAYGLATNGQGDLFVAGRTNSANFPMKEAWRGPQGSSDVFVARIKPAQSGAASLVYSTYIGGSGDDVGYGIAAGPGNSAVVTGWTAGASAGTIPAPVIGPNGAGAGVFVAKLDPNLNRVYLPAIRK